LSPEKEFRYIISGDFVHNYNINKGNPDIQK